MEKIVNNVIIFILAYLLVFFVVQISTILPAFSHDVPVIVYSSYLDFNALTSANSDEVWKSADNVINIFGSAIILLVLLFFISVVLLLRWKSKRIWIQRLLFWVIICSFIRFFNGFVCGHLFTLWSFNLVTDFIGLTFPSKIAKVFFVIVMIILLGFGMYFLREIIVGIINPLLEDVKKQLKNNVIYPSIIGSLLVFLILFPISHKSATIETVNIIITPLLLASLFRLGVAKKFSFIDKSAIEIEEKKEHLFIPLLILTALLSVSLRVVFDKGVKITPNNYDNYILDNLLAFVVISLLLILFLYLLFAYFHHHKKQKQETQEQINTEKAYQEMRDYHMFDFSKSRNLHKCNRGWDEMDNEK